MHTFLFNSATTTTASETAGAVSMVLNKANFDYVYLIICIVSIRFLYLNFLVG